MIDHNKLFGGLYLAIMRGKMPKISIIGHFLSRTSLKKFSDKTFVDNKKVIIILSIFKKYV